MCEVKFFKSSNDLPDSGIRIPFKMSLLPYIRWTVYEEWPSGVPQ